MFKHKKNLRQVKKVECFAPAVVQRSVFAAGEGGAVRWRLRKAPSGFTLVLVEQHFGVVFEVVTMRVRFLQRVSTSGIYRGASELCFSLSTKATQS